MQGRMNIPVRGGGAGATLNVFAQSTEPASKEGLWIKTIAGNGLPAITKFEYEGVKVNTNELLNDLSNQYTSIAEVQYGGLSGVPSVVVGTDIYLMGTLNGGPCKKYSTTDNTYTQISDNSYNYQGACIALVGTDIYLFGGSWYDRVHKYDIANDTYTQLSNMPFRVYNTGCVVYGTDIYFFGGEYLYGKVYKYDTVNETYTQVSTLPVTMNYCSATIKGSDVYLFGYSGSFLAYKYNILTDTYTQLQNKPSNCYASRIALVGNSIFFFGGGDFSNDQVRAYRYDILTNSYTQLQDIPIRFNRGCCNAVGDYIYLLGDYQYNNRAYKYKVINLINNYVYALVDNSGIDIKLLDNVILPINNAFINNNGSVQMYPAYYGDGIQWNLLSA